MNCLSILWAFPSPVVHYSEQWENALYSCNYRRKPMETWKPARNHVLPGNTWSSAWHAQSSLPWLSQEFLSVSSSSWTAPMTSLRQERCFLYFSFFWPRNVVKRGICYDNVCSSVRPMHLWVTPKQFEILKYFLYHAIERSSSLLSPNIHQQEVAYRLSIDTKIGDLEWPWTACYTEIGTRPPTSKCLKLVSYCLRQKCSPKNLLFSNMRAYIIH